MTNFPVRCPSVATFVRRLGTTEEEAKTVRAILKGDKHPEDFPQTAEWVRQCYHRPRPLELKLSAANEVLGLHGVEMVELHVRKDESMFAYYLNSGDTYSPTLAYVNGVWSITTLGDLVEKHDRYNSY